MRRSFLLRVCGYCFVKRGNIADWAAVVKEGMGVNGKAIAGIDGGGGKCGANLCQPGAKPKK